MTATETITATATATATALSSVPAFAPDGSAPRAIPAGDLAALRRVALDLAEVSAAAIRPWFRQPVPVDDKADATPVSQADREAETVMRDLIARHRPGDGIIGEEYGREAEGADWVWVLDPIDGTSAFLSGLATFGTLIGLCYRGWPVLGIINQPITGECWLGICGQGAWLNGRSVACRPCNQLDQATVFTTDAALFTRPEDAAAYDRLRRATRRRRYGCDCYAYGLLAAGFADLVCEAGLKLHDYAALAPVVQGAGGIMTDWDGRALHMASGDRVLASGDATAHAAALACLAGADPSGG